MHYALVLINKNPTWQHCEICTPKSLGGLKSQGTAWKPVVVVKIAHYGFEPARKCTLPISTYQYTETYNIQTERWDNRQTDAHTDMHKILLSWHSANRTWMTISILQTLFPINPVDCIASTLCFAAARLKLNSFGGILVGAETTWLLDWSVGCFLACSRPINDTGCATGGGLDWRLCKTGCGFATTGTGLFGIRISRGPSCSCGSTFIGMKSSPGGCCSGGGSNLARSLRLG